MASRTKALNMACAELVKGEKKFAAFRYAVVLKNSNPFRKDRAKWYLEVRMQEKHLPVLRVELRNRSITDREGRYLVDILRSKGYRAFSVGL